MSNPYISWPSTSAAAKLVGVTVGQFEKLVIKGDFHPQMVDGIKRYDPDELMRYVAARRGASDHRETVVNELVAALKASNGHVASLITSATSASEKLLALYGSEAAAMRTRLDQLETRNLHMLEVFEQAMSATHARELERMKVAGSEKRKTQAFDSIVEHVPTLMKQVAGNTALRKLFESLDEDRWRPSKAQTS